MCRAGSPREDTLEITSSDCHDQRRATASSTAGGQTEFLGRSRQGNLPSGQREAASKVEGDVVGGCLDRISSTPNLRDYQHTEQRKRRRGRQEMTVKNLVLFDFLS